jgi:hypothetical protein
MSRTPNASSSTCSLAKCRRRVHAPSVGDAWRSAIPWSEAVDHLSASGRQLSPGRRGIVQGDECARREPLSQGVHPWTTSCEHEREILETRIVADEQSRRNHIGKPTEALQERLRRRGVQLVLHQDLRLCGQRASDELKGLSTPLRGRAQHQCGRNAAWTQLLGQPPGIPLTPPRQRSLVVGDLGFGPARLGVSEQMDGLHTSTLHRVNLFILRHPDYCPRPAGRVPGPLTSWIIRVHERRR